MTASGVRVAVVTGGASGIGYATATLLADRGYRLVLMDLDTDKLSRAIKSMPGVGCRGIPTDVTDTASVDAAFASVAEQEERLDILVNCAGISRPVPFLTQTDEQWNLMIDINLNGSMRTMRAAHGLLARSPEAAIVNISSEAARMGMPGRSAYTATKAAIDGITRTLAVEFGPQQIRVNAVAPGYTMTPLNQTLVDQGLLQTQPVIDRTPLGRFAEPEEIAKAIVFLATPDSSFVNGQSLMVDGGLGVEGNWYEK